MKIGRETGFPNSVNHAAGDAYNAVQLSSASVAECTVFDGRTTAQRPLTDAAPSNRRAEESQARWRLMRNFREGKYRSVE
jgi:hypothetical protein